MVTEGLGEFYFQSGMVPKCTRPRVDGEIEVENGERWNELDKVVPERRNDKEFVRFVWGERPWKVDG